MGQSSYALGGRRLIARGPGTRMVAEEEVLALLLTGLTLKEIAEQMRCAYGTVRRIARKPEFLLQVREKSAEIAKRFVTELATSQVDFAMQLEEASARGLEEMMKMMDEIEGPSVLKFKIAQDVLDRDPRASRTKRFEAATTHEFINPDVLQRAAVAAREIGRVQVIDVEPSPTNGNDTGHSDNSGNG